MLNNKILTNFEESSELIPGNEVIVPQGDNFIVLSLQDHTWVSVFSGSHLLFTEQSSNKSEGFFLSPGTYTIQTDGIIESVSSKAIETPPSLFDQLLQNPPAQLRLTTDAPDQHIIDGIGEIPANGTSFCTITIQKISIDGTPLTSDDHQDEIFLRTTGGTLMDNIGQNWIRTLTLTSGQATFRLISEPQPKLVTISVFGREPFISKAEIQIEFIPSP